MDVRSVDRVKGRLLARVRRRISQPPVDPERRNPERHGFWLGAALILIALALIVTGSMRVTALPTVDGLPATEVELMRSFASGGLQRVPPPTPPSPMLTPDPVAFALAMESWQREIAAGNRVGFQVDTAAADPCPT